MEVVIDQQAEKLSTSPEKSPLVGMASTAGSGSPGKPIDAVTEPGFSGAMEDGKMVFMYIRTLIVYKKKER